MENVLPYTVLLPIGRVACYVDIPSEPSKATMDWLMTPGRGRWSGRLLMRDADDGIWHDWLYNIERAMLRCCSRCCSIPRPSATKVLQPLTTDPDDPPLADDAAPVPARRISSNR
jgi:hypothetical protein